MAGNAGRSTILYTKEGRNSSVAISHWNNGTIYVNVNGHVEATTEIYDMKLQRMVGHLPALLHPNPKSVLGIGFGAGVSAGTFTRYPGIEHITVCEIEPVIPPASTHFFGKQDYEVALNPKTHIVFDDARHYLMTTTDKYDIIASDPLDVFVKGTAALYSKEYFESVKRHLNPGGMFTLYVPLYETDEPTIKSELATFFAAFPYGSVWANLRDGLGYDMVFMGQMDPLHIDLDEVQQRVDREDYAPVRESLREIGVGSLFDLFSTYTGSASDLAPLGRGRGAQHGWRSEAELSGGLGNQFEQGGRLLSADAEFPQAADAHLHRLGAGSRIADERVLDFVAHVSTCRVETLLDASSVADQASAKVPTRHARVRAPQSYFWRQSSDTSNPPRAASDFSSMKPRLRSMGR